MNSMFEAVCPLTFSFGSIIFEDFENERGGYNVGTVDNKIEPFCGRQSIRRPWRIYPFTSQQTEIELRFYQTFYVRILSVITQNIGTDRPEKTV